MKMQAKVIARIVAGVVALAVTPTYAAGPAELRVSSSPQHGDYLTNGSGLALYAFSRDIPASANDEAVINCRQTCLEIWTPLFTSGTPRVGPQVRASQVGTTEFTDRRVVTYNGVPVYTYLVDNEPGDTEGQGMESFNGRWRLVRPNGKGVAVR